MPGVWDRPSRGHYLQLMFVALEDLVSPPPALFVNPDRGEPGLTIPSTTGEFINTVARPLPPAILPAPSKRTRRAPKKNALPATPRRSTRLAKKTMRRTPTVVAAQNVLLRKLGLAADAPSDSEDYMEYVRMFADGLTPDQARMIDELFAQRIPEAEQLVVDELQEA